MINFLIAIVFITGYLAIIFEQKIHLNKAASALLTGVLCWVSYAMFQQDSYQTNEALEQHLGEISNILFFLLGAMTIVELIDVHDGFEFITERISTKSAQKLLWIIGFITFFLSAILDNLTTTIVMITLIRKLIKFRNHRLLFAGIIVIAANAGGAWSPLGDVSTTMLWIGGQISPLKTISRLFLPSFICLLIPLWILHFKYRGITIGKDVSPIQSNYPDKKERNIILFTGIAVLLFVPFFKTITHLPPYMGILLGLGIMWIVTAILHHKKNEEDKDIRSVSYAMRKIDTPSILFFLGILLAVAALQQSGQLKTAADWLSANIKSDTIVVSILGLLSSVVDNVPLVAGLQGMYDLDIYPKDHFFWQFLAYCTGTGGSTLIIGSAAGVAAMGMEKIDFFWYIKNISLLALSGYFVGAIIYLLQQYFIFN